MNGLTPTYANIDATDVSNNWLMVVSGKAPGRRLDVSTDIPLNSINLTKMACDRFDCSGAW